MPLPSQAILTSSSVSLWMPPSRSSSASSCCRYAKALPTIGLSMATGGKKPFDRSQSRICSPKLLDICISCPLLSSSTVRTSLLSAPVKGVGMFSSISPLKLLFRLLSSTRRSPSICLGMRQVYGSTGVNTIATSGSHSPRIMNRMPNIGTRIMSCLDLRRI